MARSLRQTPLQMITKLREAQINLGQDKTVKEASKQLEIGDQTYYRWRRDCGGMDVTQAKKLKQMEKENDWLKKLFADLSLDNAILKEVPLEVIMPDSKRQAFRQAVETLDVYGHLMPSKQEEAAQLMDNLLSPMDVTNCTIFAPKQDKTP